MKLTANVGPDVEQVVLAELAKHWSFLSVLTGAGLTAPLTLSPTTTAGPFTLELAPSPTPGLGIHLSVGPGDLPAALALAEPFFPALAKVKNPVLSGNLEFDEELPIIGAVRIRIEATAARGSGTG